MSHHRAVYVGDGSSDVHVMMHVNRLDGLTIAVSENKYITQIAQRTILSDDALSVLVPVFEEILGWDSTRIRAFFEAEGFVLREWDKVRTDTIMLVPDGGVRAAVQSRRRRLPRLQGRVPVGFQLSRLFAEDGRDAEAARTPDLADAIETVRILQVLDKARQFSGDIGGVLPGIPDGVHQLLERQHAAGRQPFLALAVEPAFGRVRGQPFLDPGLRCAP